MQEITKIILSIALLITLAIMPGLINGWEFSYSMISMFIIGLILFIRERQNKHI